jgi:L-seryl-tRNA(Ser) seleniumtransferase
VRNIPSIEQMRQRPGMRALEAQFGRAALVEALRLEAAALRGTDDARDLAPEDVAALVEHRLPARLAATAGASLRAVVNATGVIIHTNLGRAPLAPIAAERVAQLAMGYTNLEYDIAAGRRGRRDQHAERLLCALTGAAAAVVVNNNAAATLIALAAVAAGREVIISRGELVEIGGGFRVPDVMAQSGAVLREVGTTNRTRAADYAAAIGDRTAAILRVHPSNFRIEGFTERPPLAELVALGRRFRVPVLEDLGSGWLGSASATRALADEPIVSESIASGADLVMFSGDKLLGGPQAGIVAGQTGPVDSVRRHPLMRALRVDKMTYAALEATLQEHVSGRGPASLPVMRMLTVSTEEIGERATRLASEAEAAGFDAEVVDGVSTIGGGSAPGAELATRLVALRHPAHDAAGLEAALRAADPPVIARIEHERVVLDLRTVLYGQDQVLVRILASVGGSDRPQGG